MWSRPPFSAELRARLGTPRRVRAVDSSPRSRVWRAELSGTPVVVKQLVAGPEADERFTRETAALRLAATVDPPVVPRLLGTDPAARTLVLERLDHAPPADDWIVGYAASLARLHAAAGPGATPALPAWSGPTLEDADSFLALARTLGCPAPPAVRAELEALVARLARSPERRALLHGDPCPGNDLHTGDGVRFIDFEQAALGDGRVELAYLRIGFPTCWCVTAPPRPLLDAAEAAYRTAWREATETDVPADLTDVCAGWLIQGDALVERARRDTTDHLAELPREDWRWGTATARQRLAHRLHVLTQLPTGDNGLAHLGQLATLLTEKTHTHWPALRPLPTRRP